VRIPHVTGTLRTVVYCAVGVLSCMAGIAIKSAAGVPAAALEAADLQQQRSRNKQTAVPSLCRAVQA
jgi:hypothetical protein